MASIPQVCCLLPPPERMDALAAVARTIGLIRRRRALSAKEIAASLKNDDGTAPIADTIERAEKSANLLSFDLIAQLAYLYGDCADPIRSLLEPAPTAEATTLVERLDRIDRETATIRRELEA